MNIGFLNPIQARGGGKDPPPIDVDTLLDPLGSEFNSDTFCKFLNIPTDQFKTIKKVGGKKNLRGKKKIRAIL